MGGISAAVDRQTREVELEVQSRCGLPTEAALPGGGEVLLLSANGAA